jgi:hypothetical protein
MTTTTPHTSTVLLKVGGAPPITTHPTDSPAATINTSFEGYPITVLLPQQTVAIKALIPQVKVSVPTPEIHVATPAPVIKVNVTGSPGPRGLPGTGGGGGGTGSDVDVTRIDVPAPSAKWHVDIGRQIGALRVMDSSGAEVEPGDIKASGTALDLFFSAAFSGTVFVTG